jgi:hypothetical protein
MDGSKFFGESGNIIMRYVLRFLLVVNVLVFLGFCLSSAKAADPAQTKNQNQWRYAYHNNEWWYWLPENRWVYWRENKWNDYNRQTYISPNSLGNIAIDPAVSVNGAAGATDIRPFYGHAVSNLDRRAVETDNEVGPFYGHVLPSEIFGYRSRNSLRPFYGHAVSSYDY